jgi:transposase
MNAIGIDVSKGKSTVAVIKPFGEVVKAPFDILHTTKDLAELTSLILSLDGESRVVMEHTGKYSDPVVAALCKAGIFVCVVNAKLVHDYGGDTIRRVKTDKVDDVMIYNDYERCMEDLCKDVDALIYVGNDKAEVVRKFMGKPVRRIYINEG